MRSPARRLLLILVLLALPLYGRPRAIQHRGTGFDSPPVDIFSASEPAAVQTTHLDLDLEVDFDHRVIRGTATHTIRNFAGTTRFVLDTSDLDIASVTVDGRPGHWVLGASGNSFSGRPLTIDILPDTSEVSIRYATRPTAGGLYWLTPLQTQGDVEPFLYSETEPDDTRTWIPLQDTPAVRMTWRATVRVPPDLLALMSGSPNPVELDPEGVYTFSMDRTVPPYLIAIAVGRLEFHQLDERTGFYCEPEVAADALRELQYVPAMLDAAERIIAPYPFNRYDILVAPPGFVAGGMENPELNFINVMNLVKGNLDWEPLPSYVVAHEIAHSWMGDLVTCATWNDTWLNEGFATYYAGRIMEEAAGFEEGDLRHYFSRTSYDSYVAAVGSSAPSTALHRQFKPGDALQVFTTTSYSKGGLFLKTLEDLLGRDVFDRFVRYYLSHNEWHWVDDRRFLDALRSTAFANDPDLEQQLMVQEWVYGTGLPSNVTAPASTILWSRAGVQAEAFRSGRDASLLDTTGWTETELFLFLWQINNVIADRMAELDAKFGLTRMTTPPMDWLLAVAQTRWEPAMPAFEAYLLKGGPNVIGLYDRLSRTTAGRQWARAFYYQRARPHYAPNIQFYVDSIFDQAKKAA